ncbi:hypothetical protein F5B20DRAFT_352845 [Whalleya microplaca]|nr:hypothetical protein F5B20DRAFT_352845 [Whalleya microplaca]
MIVKGHFWPLLAVLNQPVTCLSWIIRWLASGRRYSVYGGTETASFGMGYICVLAAHPIGFRTYHNAHRGCCWGNTQMHEDNLSPDSRDVLFWRWEYLENLTYIVDAWSAVQSAESSPNPDLTLVNRKH